MPEAHALLPAWRAARPGLDRCWRWWLYGQDSLTQRLVARSTAFEVVRLAEGKGRLAWDEQQLLGGTERFGWVREVALVTDGTAVVFARSVLPFTAVHAWPLFFRVGNRPLGALLFADPTIVRSRLTAAVIRPGHFLGRRAAAHCLVLLEANAQLWARRSLFWRRRRPLLVQELFLPPFTP